MNMEKLSRFNEWWATKKVKASLLQPHKRPLFFNIRGYLSKRQILLITGLRRVGKTTLMYQIIQELLDTTKENAILYFSFDEESVDLEDLIKTYEESILKRRIDSERTYIFLDEIQKCKDWQKKIKILYDLNPNVKFILSGSASVQISRKAKGSLAGRIFDFVLEPLSFNEFLEWKNIKIATEKIEFFGNIITPLFHDYLRKGGFPEMIDEDDDEKIRNYIKNSIIEQIVYKDLPEEFGIKDYELLKTLIEMIAVNPGMIINYDELSRRLKRSKKTIIDYFFYLGYSMLIKTVANYRKGFLVSSRKMKKAYPNNTAISFVFAGNFYSESFLQRLAENFAIIETGAKNYYRNRYEIDIIIKAKGKIIPIEVKYGRVEATQMADFLEEFGLNRAIILTKDTFEKRTANKKQILLVPVWAFPLLKDRYLNWLGTPAA